jgi:hypothetical protein
MMSAAPVSIAQFFSLRGCGYLAWFLRLTFDKVPHKLSTAFPVIGGCDGHARPATAFSG